MKTPEKICLIDTGDEVVWCDSVPSDDIEDSDVVWYTRTPPASTNKCEEPFKAQRLALEYCNQYGITGEKLTTQITNAFCVGYGFDRTPSPSADKLIAAAIEMDKANNSGDTVRIAISQLRLSDAVTEREALLNALFVAKGGLEDE